MIMPESGRVVIIDDKFKEALPLIRMLSKRRVAVNFFTGMLEELPEEPFRDVRVVFMDVMLEGVDIRNEKTVISTLLGVTEKIVSKENGPFVLAVWTKHPEMVKKVQTALKGKGYYILGINLEKDKYFEKLDGRWEFNKKTTDDFKEFEEEIEQKINEIDIFKVFMKWENLIHDAASKTVNEISKFVEYNGNWNDEMKKIFYNLAKAWAGKIIEDMENAEKIRSAFYSFHQIFSDVFERELQRTGIEEISLEDGSIDRKIKGKINFQILLDEKEEGGIYPGNVYEDDKINLEFIKGILNEDRDDILNNVIENSISVLLEVTPLCDFVQRKVKRYRVVKGILIPDSIDDNNDNIWRKIKKTASFIYVSPEIHYNGRNYRMVLDFRYFTSFEYDDLKNRRVLFRIRKELLSDIQIKLSSHINRTGVLYLE